jgi:nicotinamidase-related amidase
MPVIKRERSTLLIIDFQIRLMPAIFEGAAAVANARRLIDAANLLGVPTLLTEQNPEGLGATVAELADPDRTCRKTTFDAVRSPAFSARLPADGALIVAGCEAHVCVLQTVLGLRARGREVFLVRDALGSRRPENRDAAVLRMAANGVEVVTTEMVIFEWLESSEHPDFRAGIALVKEQRPAP